MIEWLINSSLVKLNKDFSTFENGTTTLSIMYINATFSITTLSTRKMGTGSNFPQLENAKSVIWKSPRKERVCGQLFYKDFECVLTGTFWNKGEFKKWAASFFERINLRFRPLVVRLILLIAGLGNLPTTPIVSISRCYVDGTSGEPPALQRVRSSQTGPGPADLSRDRAEPRRRGSRPKRGCWLEHIFVFV